MKCSFCGNDFSNKGMLYVTKTGKSFYFCSSKCEKNKLKLKRNPRRAKWTKVYEKEKKGGE